MAEQAKTGLDAEPNQDQRDESASEPKLTEKQVNDMIGKALSARLRPFDNQFAEIKALLAPKEAKAESAEDAPKVDTKVAKLETELKALQAERSRIRSQNLRSTVKNSLISNGVNPDVVEPLLALHLDSRKAIGFASEQSDEIVFKLGDGTFGLDDGIKQWLATDSTSQAFMTRKGVSGSGDSGYRSNVASPPNKHGLTPEQDLRVKRLLGR